MARVLLFLICALLPAAAGAQRQSLPCDAFVRNVNGCWSPTRQVTISNAGGENVLVSPGVTFCQGVSFLGLNLAEMLHKQCTRWHCRQIHGLRYLISRCDVARLWSESEPEN